MKKTIRITFAAALAAAFAPFMMIAVPAAHADPDCGPPNPVTNPGWRACAERSQHECGIAAGCSPALRAPTQGLCDPSLSPAAQDACSSAIIGGRR
jgi:hypothetical protein